MWKLSIVVLLVLGSNPSILADDEDNGITEIVIERMDFPMGDKSTLFRNIDLQVIKFNRTTSVLDGSIEFLMPISDELRYKLDTFYHVSGNEYRLIVTKTEFKFCTQLSTSVYSVVMKSMYENAGMASEYGKCPIDWGKIKFTNYHASNDLSNPFTGAISMGENWKVTVSFMKGVSNAIIGVVEVYLRVKNEFSD